MVTSLRALGWCPGVILPIANGVAFFSGNIFSTVEIARGTE